MLLFTFSERVIHPDILDIKRLEADVKVSQCTKIFLTKEKDKATFC